MLVRIADIVLDERCFELRRGGRRVAVQPKVLDLLLYLVRHRDRLVSRDELFAQVWAGVAVGEGSLSQAISIVRKLIDGAGESCIRTVRGRGFQFVGQVTPLPEVAPAPALASSWTAPTSAPPAVLTRA